MYVAPNADWYGIGLVIIWMAGTITFGFISDKLQNRRGHKKTK